MRFSLQPPPGIYSDDTTFSSPGVWEDASNVRFRLGKPEVIGGWAHSFTTTLTGVCRNIIVWTQIDGSPVSAYGTHSKLQAYSGGALYDITPSGLATGAIDSSSGAPGYGSGAYGSGTYGSPASDYYARTWSFSTYGEMLIANPRGGTIYQWENDPLTAAVAVTNAPAQVQACLVTEERQLLAFGCTDSGGDYSPLCIRGTDIENITDWTPGTSDNAFEDVLEGGGRIVGPGRKFGSYVAVWTDVGVYLGQFLGQQGQTYRWDLVAQDCGLIAPNAAVIVDQRAFWIAPDLQFRVWELGSSPQILKCPIWKDFVDNLDTSQKEKIVAAGVSKHGEIWFHYPDSRDGNENSRYLSFNIADNTWSKGILARSAAVDAGVATNPIMVTPTGDVFYHEYGLTANGSDLDWFIKCSDQYLDEGGQAMQIQGIRPDFEDQGGSIDLTLEVRQYPQADPVTKGPYALAVGAQKKDFRATGQVVSVKFSGTDYSRLGKNVFPLVRAGRRS